MKITKDILKGMIAEEFGAIALDSAPGGQSTPGSTTSTSRQEGDMLATYTSYDPTTGGSSTGGRSEIPPLLLKEFVNLDRSLGFGNVRQKGYAEALFYAIADTTLTTKKCRDNPHAGFENVGITPDTGGCARSILGTVYTLMAEIQPDFSALVKKYGSILSATIIGRLASGTLFARRIQHSMKTLKESQPCV